MRQALLLAAVFGLVFSLSSSAFSDHYLNQTKEERPRKKKKVKGFDYEKSRYVSKATDIGGHYTFTEDGKPVVADAKKKGKKPEAAEEGAEPAADAGDSNAALGETKPKPAFRRVNSFGSSSKKSGQMTPEEALKAGQAAQKAAGGGAGAGQWNNFQTGGGGGYGAGANAGYGQGNPGQVKVMP